ncbi:MAG: CPBP family intramembrane glutamic endopeptidase [bacterium]
MEPETAAPAAPTPRGPHRAGLALVLAAAILVLHQAGTALLVAGWGRPAVAILVSGLLFLLYPTWRLAQVVGSPRDVLRLGGAPARVFPLAAAALITAMPVAIGIGHRIVPADLPEQQWVIGLVRGTGAADVLVAWAAAALVPAIGEEWLYRGLLQRALERTLPGAAAIATQAVAFGLVHGPARAIPATLLGLLLGWIARRTGSVWPGVVAHLVSNSSIVVLANLGDGSAAEWGTKTETSLAAGFVGAAVTAVLVGAIARACPRPPSGSDPIPPV